MKRTVVAVALIVVLAATSMTVFSQVKRASEKAKDPVCGIMVDKDPSLSANYRGEAFYFCSRADMERFKQEPEKYVRKR